MVSNFLRLQQTHFFLSPLTSIGCLLKKTQGRRVTSERCPDPALVTKKKNRPMSATFGSNYWTQAYLSGACLLGSLDMSNLRC